MRTSIYTLSYLLGLSILFLNDWFWKYQYGNFWTGKLSDFMGLFLLALFLAALLPKQRKISFLSLSLCFIWWKSPFSEGVIELWNDYIFFSVQRTIDYTDYIALTVIPIANWLSKQRVFYEYRNLVLNKPFSGLQLILFSSSIFVFSSTSRAPSFYIPGNILIEESLVSQRPLDSIKALLLQSGYRLTIDSVYYTAYGDTAYYDPYYQIHNVQIGPRTGDTADFVNFKIHENSQGERVVYIINMQLRNQIELQDWRILKEETKRCKELLQARFTKWLLGQEVEPKGI